MENVRFFIHIKLVYIGHNPVTISKTQYQAKTETTCYFRYLGGASVVLIGRDSKMVQVV